MIALDDVSQVVSVCAKTLSGTNRAVYIVDLIKKRSIQSFMALLREIAKERQVNVTDRSVQLKFVEPGYILAGYPLTWRVDGQERKYIGKLG